jgi:hypothetical protein
LYLKYGYNAPVPEGVKEVNGIVQRLENIFILNHVKNEPEALKEFIESEKKEISMSKQIFQDSMTVSDDGKRVFVGLANTIDGSFGWLPIEKLQKQGENAALGAVKNINSKEKIMSNEFENIDEETIAEDKELSPEQLAAKNAWMEASHRRKVINDAIIAGTLGCLPGADGYADTAPAQNIMKNDDKVYHNANQLFLKDHQKQNGFPTAEYITYDQIKKAQEDNPDMHLFIRKGEKGVFLHVSEKITEDKWEEKHIRLFNVAQVNKPKELKV